jgi:hypothetical protein
LTSANRRRAPRFAIARNRPAGSERVEGRRAAAEDQGTAGGSGVSEGVDGIDPERASRGFHAGQQSRTQHHRGCHADPGGERHDVVCRPAGRSTAQRHEEQHEAAARRDAADLEKDGIDSLWVQEKLGVAVVKVFNSILATSLQSLGKSKGDKNRIALAVSGNNPKAKEAVFELVDELGFDPFDVGTIDQSWKQQPGSSIYCKDIPLEELQMRVAAMGASWSDLRDVILTKRKADEVFMRADYEAYLKALHD